MCSFNIFSRTGRCVIAALFVAVGLSVSGVNSAARALPGSASAAVADNAMVSGVVVDKSGAPIVGAAVYVKGNMSSGTMTDVDGKFTISCPVSSVLVFSALSYADQEFAVSKNVKDLEIRLMDDAQQLEEIVVVGYGKQKKETVTGSIAAVKGEELRRSPESNLTNSLVGRMPGLIARGVGGEPGNDYSEILIRGKASFGDTQPLFVIDGVANRWGNIDNLNPNDIESITILKDASAAIYGAQAANGVILVTTKRGREGKPTITYEGNVSLSGNTRTPKLMNAYQFMDYDDEINMYQYPDDPSKQKYRDIKDKYIDGSNDPKLNEADTDWMGVVFQKYAPKTRHSVSISGGTERVNYYFSGSYLYQEPCYKDTPFNFQTFQIRSNVEAKITKDFTLGLELATRQENRNQSNYSTSDLFWEAYNAYPFLPDYYVLEDGSKLPGPGISWGNNIAILTKGGTGYYRQKDYYVNTKVNFDLQMPWITKGLYINGYVAFDKRFQHTKTQNGMWDAYQYNRATGNYDNIYDTTGYQTIQLSEQKYDMDMTTFMARIGYERTFNDHSVNAFVAYEQSREQGDWISAYRQGFYSHNPDYMFAGADEKKNNNGSAYVKARQHIFGRVSYGYKNRYLAEFTLRYDGSMNFPKNSRWGLFPGLSLGWRMTEEKWMQNVSWLDELKIKASIGQLGNDRVASFQYLQNYDLGVAGEFGHDPIEYKGFTASTVPNPNITWEVATNYNIGFESRFIRNKFYLDAQYFYQHRTNILTPRNASLPDYTGLTLPDENIGVIDNQGVELELTYRDAKGDWTWYAGGTFTFARNKVIFFDEAKDVPAWQRRTGFPIDSYLLYKSDGLYQNQDDIDGSVHFANAIPGDIRYIDYNGDGTLSSSDMVRIFKSATPEIVYGINLGASWKGIELNVLFQGQGRAAAYVVPQAANRESVYYTDRWISEEKTPNAKYPRAFYYKDDNNLFSSDFWLRDAWFLRLKNLELAYNFPKKWMEKAKMQGVRVYVSGSNLFTIDAIKILDPESASQNSGRYYPQQRIFNFGVSVTF